MANEQQRHQEWDALDDRLRRELRRPARVDPAAVGRIMDEVRATPRPRPAAAPWREALAWLFRPRQLTLSPMGALAAVSLAVLLGALAARGGDGPRPGEARREIASAPATPPPSAPVQQAAREAPATQNVQFVFVSAEASTVSVVGDFNDWDLAATPLRRTGSGGIWSVVVPLPAGEHQYSYVVDGKTWVPDASAPQSPAGEFGGTNSVLFVGGQS
jgi:hypothetical protein